MKTFLKPFTFLVLSAFIFLLIDEKCYDGKSHTTSNLADLHTDHYDFAFFGASRIMKGIKPALINQVLGIKTVAYAESALSEDLIYELLYYVANHKKMDAIIIDAARVGSTADTLFEGGYEGQAYRFYDGIRNPFERAKAIVSTIPNSYIDYFPEAFSPLFRDVKFLKVLELLSNKPEHIGVLGFDEIDEISHNFQNLTETSYQYKEKYRCDNYIYIYMEKLLNFAKEEGISVYFILLPTQSYSPVYANNICVIESFAEKYENVEVWNVSAEMDENNFKNYDFQNDHHLNRMGASKATEYVIDKLADITGKTPDYSKAAMYRGESVELVKDNIYRYKVDVYPNTDIFFQYIRGKDVIKETDWGETDFMELPKLAKNEKLHFCIRPKTIYENTFPKEEQCYDFMLTPEIVEKDRQAFASNAGK